MKFRITWYCGDPTVIGDVIAVKEIEVEDEKDAQSLATTILPEPIRRKIHYCRYTFVSDALTTIDYGSWSKFIAVEKLNG